MREREQKGSKTERMKVSRGTREGREARGGRNASSLLRPSTVNDFLSWAVKTVLFYFFKKIGSNSTASVAATHPRYHERYARGRERKILEQDTKNSLKKNPFSRKASPIRPTVPMCAIYLQTLRFFQQMLAFLSDACAFCSGWKRVCVCARAWMPCVSGYVFVSVCDFSTLISYYWLVLVMLSLWFLIDCE